MFDEIFLLIFSGVIALLFAWAFRTLPAEGWQIVACLPGRKSPDGTWHGVNFTYYGFFNAVAYVFAVVMFLLMTGSLDITMEIALSVVIPVLAICMWAARVIARLVEKKHHTFSVGAAAFTGIIIAPIVIILLNATVGQWWAIHIPVTQTMAAMFIAYAFGEGMGRLACISFGCCYGKPLKDCNPFIRKIFRRWNFVFWGKTKKIAYADDLEGVAVIPVQALTAVLYTGTGLLSFYLFLKGFAAASLILTLMTTQIWRFVSEFLRADYRGNGRISAYQVMTLIAIAYTLVILTVTTKSGVAAPNLLLGITSLWNPGLLIFLAILWVVSFVYTGRSSVTTSWIDIQVVKKNI
ncbi:MAG: hypothetical protein FD159_963 [Syntrophaceae bacterium]|nr:MAG: hypothetical protein FD159_963 [Syntrophaceae bacterium]